MHGASLADQQVSQAMQNEPVRGKRQSKVGQGEGAELGGKPTWREICYLWKASIRWWERNGKYVTQSFCNYK